MLAVICEKLVSLKVLCYRYIVGYNPFLRFFWNTVYELGYGFIDLKQDTVPFTNYGYDLNADPLNYDLDTKVNQHFSTVACYIPTELQSQVYSIQLCMATLLQPYIYKDLTLDNANVLEVGCGKGGGCMVLHGLAKPKSYLGVDLSNNGVVRCRKVMEMRYGSKIDNCDIDFKVGDATDLVKTVKANSYDYCFNIESSHCYPSFQSFLEGVYACLKSGGHFLWADVQLPNDMIAMKWAFNKTGLKTIGVREISRNVSSSLQKGSLDPTEKIIRQVCEEQTGLKGLLVKAYGKAGWQLIGRAPASYCEDNTLSYHMIIAKKVVGDELVELRKSIGSSPKVSDPRLRRH